MQVLERPDYEVVCCRAVSHLTSGADVRQLDDVSVHPEVEHTRDLARAIAEQVPGAGYVLNRERPYVYEPPHGLLVTRTTTRSDDPYAVARELAIARTIPLA